jgi:3-oxoacyl-[acyl-carrier-protein] synthase-3
VYQDIKLLNENIVKLGVRFFKSVMERHHLRTDEIDWFLPHLSSMLFRRQLYDEMVARDVPIPAEKWFTNLPEKGNTGSASILVALEECINSGKFKPGDQIICGVPESARFTYACMCLTAV